MYLADLASPVACTLQSKAQRPILEQKAGILHHEI